MTADAPGDAAAAGGELLIERRPHEAIWALLDARDERPGDAAVRRQIARALVMAHLPRQALAFLTRSREGSSAVEVEDRRVAAAAYLAMADAVGAVGILVTAGEALETSAPALLDLGNAHEALGDDAAAIAAYSRHLEKAPESVTGYLALARVAKRSGRVEEAAAARERALALGREDPRVLIAASDGAADPETMLRRALRAAPDSGPAHLRLGRLLLERGQAAAAIPHLEAARAAGLAEARPDLAEALLAAGREAEARYQRGVHFLEADEPRRALQEFTRMALQEPDRPNAPVMIATAHARMEQPARAAEAAARGLARHPDSPELLALRAKMLIRSDARDEAMAVCRRWATRFPAAAEPWVLQAAMEREARRFPEAARLAEEALARAPEDPDAALEAARALAALPKPDLPRAVATIRRALEAHPDDARLPLQLAALLIRQEDAEGARRAYLRALDLDPASQAAAVGLVQHCSRAGKTERAAFYGEIVRALQERGDAARLLVRRLTQNPEDAEALARLARLHREAGDLRRARPLLARAARARPADRQLAADLRAVERILALRQL